MFLNLGKKSKSSPSPKEKTISLEGKVWNSCIDSSKDILVIETRDEDQLKVSFHTIDIKKGNCRNCKEHQVPGGTRLNWTADFSGSEINLETQENTIFSIHGTHISWLWFRLLSTGNLLQHDRHADIRRNIHDWWHDAQLYKLLFQL